MSLEYHLCIPRLFLDHGVILRLHFELSSQAVMGGRYRASATMECLLFGNKQIVDERSALATTVFAR